MLTLIGYRGGTPQLIKVPAVPGPRVRYLVIWKIQVLRPAPQTCASNDYGAMTFIALLVLRLKRRRRSVPCCSCLATPKFRFTEPSG